MTWEKMGPYCLQRLILKSGRPVIAYVGEIEGVPDGVIFLEDHPDKALAQVVKAPKMAGSLDAVIDDMPPLHVIDVLACRDRIRKTQAEKAAKEARETST